VIAAICSWLRGPVARVVDEDFRDEGFAGAGEVAMQEAGAGAALD